MVVAVATMVALFAMGGVAHAAVTINVAVTTSKATYAAGETVAINALATYIANSQPVTSIRSAKVTIRNPSGTIVVNDANMTNAGGGNYTYNYALASTAPAGTWTITATITDTRRDTGTGNGSFGVGSSNPHANLLWSGYPANCRSCHAKQFTDMYGALHYQWQSTAPDNVNTTALQGKVNSAINAYCINIQGNWGAQCGACHAGRGAQPVWTSNPTTAQLDNVDCLMCHNEAYALARVRLSTTSLGPPAGTAQATLDSYVRNVGKPTRKTCLKCHAYGGGGDGLKRGDISSMQGATTDGNHDVHMATGRGNMTCQTCHKFVNHKVTGKGSDLQSTDHAAEIKCATSECHATRQTGGHVTAAVNKHVTRVACQTCHVTKYGKGVATEMERDWRVRKANGHPSNVTATNVTPTYKFWNRKTWNYLKGNTGRFNTVTGAWETVQLQGSIAGDTTNKLYPFKYKIAYQPLRTTGSVLIALDTNEYLNISGDYALSVAKGLTGMGYSSSDSWNTVKADTYQMLNHTIADAQSTGGVLVCADCHEATTGGAGKVMNLKTMGYAKKADLSVLCTQCHNNKTWKGYVAGHSRHVDSVKADCSYCHTFSRPERGLTMPK